MASHQKKSFWAKICPSICGCGERAEKDYTVYTGQKIQKSEEEKVEIDWEAQIEARNDQVDNYLENQRKEELDDFDETKDQKKAYTEDQIKNMGRFDRFEKQFPFYQIDVNGFFHLLQRAQKLSYQDEEDAQLREMNYVTLAALQEAFSSNKTWADALANDGKLVQFLNETCKGESEDFPDDTVTLYEVRLIACLAIVWCEDEPKEKLVEYWAILQDGDQQTIAAYDKDFMVNLFQMFDISHTFVYDYEEKYTGVAGPAVNKEEIEEKREQYDQIAETFLDEVFGYADTLSKDEYLQKVLETQSWIFRPNTIRKKLGYES